MKKQEKEFIEKLIDDLKAILPGIGFRYQFMEDTHFLKVDLPKNMDQSTFLNFTIEKIESFYNSGFETMLSITNEDILVEFDRPNKFSWKSDRIKVEEISKTEILPDTSLLNCAA